MRAASGMSRTIDPRRPTQLSHDQQAQVRRHPEVRLLRRHQDGLKRKVRDMYGTTTRAKGSAIYNAYHDARRAHQNALKAVRKALIAESRTAYRKRQPVADISRQLRGDVEDKSAAYALNDSPALSQRRRRAISALLTFATSDPAEETKRRTEAIAAVAAVSRHREAPVPKACRPKQASFVDSKGRQDVDADLGVEVRAPKFSLECRPTQCIFCLGQEDLSLERRIKSFHSRGTLKRHFQNNHLQHHPDGQPIDCPHPLCKLTLEDKASLQNHAAMVHKTFT